MAFMDKGERAYGGRASMMEGSSQQFSHTFTVEHNINLKLKKLSL